MTVDMSYPAISFPTPTTLRKYGLSKMEWLELYRKQKGQCGICHRDFQVGHRINVDHEHVRGWKKMAPSERKEHIRGLLCYTCNKFMVMRGVTSMKLYNGWQYMRAYEVRVTAPHGSGNFDAGQ